MKIIFTKQSIRSVSILSSLFFLNGCFHESDDASVTPAAHFAVVTTQSDDFTSGNLSIISLTDFSIDNTNVPSISDMVVSTFNEHFYHLNRTDGNVAKFHIDEPETPISQHATQELNQPNGNPYKLVMKDEDTGYLVRWSSSEIWIVDPSAENGATYKTGSIDLSDYASEDDQAEASDALLIDDKLYVLIQNLENFAPQTAYIAIFDTANNNMEIETNSDANTPMGIALKGTNPSTFKYLSSNKTLYVANVGSYEPNYEGGIEAVNITDFSSTLIVDDGTVGDEIDHPYGQTNNVAILNSTRGYFVGSASFKNANVYAFNPTTGVVDTDAIFAESRDINDIEIGPLGNLWISNRTDKGITIINTVDNTVSQALISTDTLLPNNIEFISIQQ